MFYILTSALLMCLTINGGRGDKDVLHYLPRTFSVLNEWMNE